MHREFSEEFCSNFSFKSLHEFGAGIRVQFGASSTTMLGEDTMSYTFFPPSCSYNFLLCFRYGLVIKAGIQYKFVLDGVGVHLDGPFYIHVKDSDTVCEPAMFDYFFLIIQSEVTLQ